MPAFADDFDAQKMPPHLNHVANSKSCFTLMKH